MVQPRTNFGDTQSKSTDANILNRESVDGVIDPTRLNKIKVGDDIEFSDIHDDIRNYVLNSLGHPVVRVELTGAQLKVAADEGISHMNNHAPMWTTQLMTFTTSGGTSLYELPPHVINGLEYVVYKKQLLSVAHGIQSIESDIFIRYFQDQNIFTSFNMGDYFLVLQNLEMLRKVLGNEGSFDILDNKYVKVYPTPKFSEDVIVVYKSLNYSSLNYAYLNWIQRYALGKSKTILGLIRGKYKNIPSPAGGAQLDGPELREEGKLEMEALMEELIDAHEEPLYFTTF